MGVDIELQVQPPAGLALEPHGAGDGSQGADDRAVDQFDFAGEFLEQFRALVRGKFFPELGDDVVNHGRIEDAAGFAEASEADAFFDAQARPDFLQIRDHLECAQRIHDGIEHGGGGPGA